MTKILVFSGGGGIQRFTLPLCYYPKFGKLGYDPIRCFCVYYYNRQLLLSGTAYSEGQQSQSDLAGYIGGSFVGNILGKNLVQLAALTKTITIFRMLVDIFLIVQPLPRLRGACICLSQTSWECD
jgi:hypothetical protein